VIDRSNDGCSGQTPAHRKNGPDSCVDCAKSKNGPRARPDLPTQENIARATEMAFEALGGQTDEQMAWLGAVPQEGIWKLPVLGHALHVDRPAKRVTTEEGKEAGPFWRILALHYLAVRDQPDLTPPGVVFADIPTARSYAGVYHQRVIARLCGTAGRDLETLRAAAEEHGGQLVAEGDAGFDFNVFPRLPVRLVWHAADEEFPPSATLLLPANIEEYLCIEDVTILSECLVSRLGGRPF